MKQFTQQGLAKLRAELDNLKNVERPQTAKEIARAVAFGDLSENAAYKDAKEKKAFIEGRILELEKMLANATIIQKTLSSRVCLGSSVVVENNGKKMSFCLVAPQEVDFDKGLISVESPLGKALLNKTKGDAIEIKPPSGANSCYMVIEVS